MTNPKYLMVRILLLMIPFFASSQPQENKLNKFVSVKSINPNDTAFTDLQPLRKMIANARIVMLGEANHESGNIFDAKIRVLKFLHQEMDYDMIAFESGFYDLHKANEDIKNGKGVKLALVKSIFNIWTSTKEFQPFVEFIESTKLPVFGFDNQFSGEYIYQNLKDDINKITDGNVPEELLDTWISVVEIMAEDYSFPKRHDYQNFRKDHLFITNSVKSFEDKKGKNNIQFILQLLDNIIFTAKDYYYNRVSEKSKEDWQAKDSNIRDSLMAENLIFLASKYPKKKIVCWGATAHFANMIWELESKELKKFSPMGSYIKEKFGEEEVYILGFTGNKATVSIQKAVTIETEIAASDLGYGILDIKSMPVGTMFNSSCLSFEDDPVYGEWAKALDGLFFVGDIKPTTFYALDLKEDKTNTSLDIKDTNTVADEDQKTQNTSIYKIIKGDKDQLIIVSGRVIENNGGNGIAYANIGIRGTYIGTSSDEQGNYVIKMPKEYKHDTIRISCIGYKEMKIAIDGLPSKKIISLTSTVKELAEVRVSAERLTAVKIMKNVIMNISQNYTQEPYTKTTHTKLRVFDENSGKFVLQELLKETYDDNGYQKVTMSPIRYIGFTRMKHGRVAELDRLTGAKGKYEYFYSRFGVPVGLADVVDVRHNNFLSTTHIKKYEFEIKDIIKTENGNQFIIFFRAKKPSHRNTATIAPISYSGTIVINEKDYAIVKVISMVIQDRERIWKADKNPMYESKEVWFEKEVVSYKRVGEFYFLDKLYHTSNWNTRNAGFIEVSTLDVKIGKRERPEELYISLPKKGVYDPSDWIGL